MTDELRRYTLTLTEAAQALASRRLTAAELAAAQMARVRATDAAIDAWATLDPEHVQRESARWDAAPRAGPLGGVGIGVKDIIATSDLPTTMGSPIFAEHRAGEGCGMHRCISRLPARSCLARP